MELTKTEKVDLRKKGEIIEECILGDENITVSFNKDLSIGTVIGRRKI